MPKEAPFRDIAHEKFDYDGQLMHGLIESRSGLGRWSAAYGLLEVRVCSGVIELNSLDPTEIVVVPRVLGVAGGGGEGSFGDEFVGLIVQAVLKVTSQDTVDEGCFGLVVVPECRGTLSR